MGLSYKISSCDHERFVETSNKMKFTYPFFSSCIVVIFDRKFKNKKRQGYSSQNKTLKASNA